jgi:exonuclease SbcC
MKIFTAFKSPAWENRDPALRAAAVRDETAPELVAKLPDIAAQDAEAAVRSAAVARLSVPAQVLARHRDDADAGVRAAALARLTKLMLDAKAGLAPGARFSALSLDLPNELLEKIAESAPDVDSRRAALSRVSRSGFVQRRCIEETDAGLRAELLERIDGEEALDRVGEALRKRDKTLSRRARDRAEALRLARNDAGALLRYAAELCESLTLWAQQQPEDIAARVESAQTLWTARRESFDAAMQTRVEAYFARVQDACARRVARAIEPVATPDAGPEAVAHTATETPAGSYTPPSTPTPVVEADWSEFDRLLADANRALVARHLGEAKPAWQRVLDALAALPRPDRARSARLGEVQGRIDELDQWQRWSGNRVRARLCDEVEALIGAGLHPDAVANKVKELQQEWARIEATEPGDADRTSGLAKRFRALCGRVMAPTRPYFEQRHALREQRRESLDALLRETTDELIAASSVPAAIGLRRRLVEALRSLDELEPKARTALAKRLREGLARLDAYLDTQREDAALGRRKLIARLRRELTHADPATALDLARQAQLEWKQLPRAAREHEAALEQELRALIDPLFAKERSQRDEASQLATKNEQESRRILDALAALADGDAATLAHADGRIAALGAEWKALHASTAPTPPPPRGSDRDRGRDGRRDPRERSDRRNEPRRNDGRGPGARDTERAFDQAVARVRSAQQVQEQSRRGVRLRTLVEAFDLIAAIEAHGAGDDATARWEALALEEADRRRLGARWQAALQASSPAATDAKREREAELWLVAAELDHGLDSPATAQAIRRELQMERLASRLQGGDASARAPLDRLMDWIALGPLDPDQHPARRQRLDRVLEVWTR